MNNQQGQKKKDPYTKPQVYTHEPLRNITANTPAETMPSPTN